MVAVASADRRWSDSRSLACKVPADFPLEPYLATHGVLVLPDDDPQHPFTAVLAQGASAAAYIGLSYDDAVIGTLHVVRPATVPFDAAQPIRAAAAIHIQSGLGFTPYLSEYSGPYYISTIIAPYLTACAFRLVTHRR